MAATGTHTTEPSQYPRLPCRGCTADCSNYIVCEGVPWRIARDGTLSAPLHPASPDNSKA